MHPEGEQLLVFGQACTRCYDSKLAHVQEDETGVGGVMNENICDTTFVAYDLLNASA